MVKDTQVCFVSVCFGCNNKAVTKDHTGCLPGFFLVFSFLFPCHHHNLNIEIWMEKV